jgi:hypothetical protein
MKQLSNQFRVAIIQERRGAGVAPSLIGRTDEVIE